MSTLTKVVKEKTSSLIRETTVPKQKFYCSGTSKINLWGGGSGIITMDPFKIEIKDDEKLTTKIVFNNINDGGFGCESVVSCNIDINQEVEVIREFLDKNGDVLNTENEVEYLQIYEDLYIKG